MEKYNDRIHAGQILAQQLIHYAGQQDVLVLGLARGGVPVAFQISTTLNVPLDVFIVRKLGVPGHSELAMGAIGMGDTYIFNDDIISQLQIPKTAINLVIEEEKKELKRREAIYRGNYPFPAIRNKTVILVDDGIATGATMRVAIKALKQLSPASIVVAVPVADKSICDHIEPLVDSLICPLRPMNFHAVGAWYVDFSQTEDEEVHALLKKARKFVNS